MRIDFRQGIISYPTTGNLQNFLAVSGNSVSLRAAATPVQIAFAHGDADYLFTETQDVNGAWSRLPPTTKCWLYWDIDTLTGQRTFGYTDRQPIVSATPPSSAAVGQMVFDLSTNTMFQYVAPTVRRPVIRVFACAVQGSTIIPLGTGFPTRPFAGTQVGLSVPGTPGQIITDQSGVPIRLRDGVFMTTENDLFIKGSAVNPVRLDATVVTAAAAENVARYQVVKFSDFNQIQLASYDDLEETAIAMVMEDLQTHQTGTVCLQGKITNPDWNWTTVGAKLWVSEAGLLTETDPHIANAFVFPVGKAPVGRVISRDTIIFDQGLGGKGDRGAPGSSGGVEKATETVYGIVRLSVPTEVTGDPVVVGSNDPRLTDKVLRDGDTMTGPLILNGNPTQNLGAATKQYVDSRTIDDLSDVNTLGVTAGDALVYNGTSWVPGTVESGVGTLWELSDVADSVAAPSPGQVLQYNGTLWTAQNLPAPPTVPAVLNDLNDVDAIPTTNDVLTFNGTQWVAQPVAQGGNPFDQDLNTFNNVRFDTMKATGRVETSEIYGGPSVYIDVDTMAANNWVSVVRQEPGPWELQFSGVDQFNGNVTVWSRDPNYIRGFPLTFNTAGDLTAATRYVVNGGSGRITPASIVVDSDGYQYFSYHTVNAVTDSGLPAGIAKWDGNTTPGSSGLAWQVEVASDGILPVTYPDQLSLTSKTDPSKALIVSGTYYKSVMADTYPRAFMMRIDATTGAVVWSKSYSLPRVSNADRVRVNSQSIDSNGNVVITITLSRDMPTQNIIMVVKIDSATGDIILSRTLGAADGANSVGHANLNNGTIAVVTTNFYRSAIVVLDATTGSTVSTYPLAPSTSDDGRTITLDNVATDGTYIYVYGSGSSMSYSGSLYGLYLWKYDSSGTLIERYGLFSFNSTDNLYPFINTSSTIAVPRGIVVENGVAYVVARNVSSGDNGNLAIVAALDVQTPGALYETTDYVYTAVVGGITTPETQVLTNTASVIAVQPSFELTLNQSSTYLSSEPTSLASFVTTTDIQQQAALNSWGFSAAGFETPNYTLPFDDGVEGEVLVTNGAGEVTWGAPDTPFAVFLLRTVTDPIETYTDHTHTATLLYSQAIDLIRNTDPGAAVADTTVQPYVDLVTTSAVRRTSGAGIHTHTIRVCFDYKSNTFFVKSVTDNLSDNHVAEPATGRKQHHNLRMQVSGFGVAVPAAGVRYRTAIWTNFVAARVYARCDGTFAGPVTVDVLCEGQSLTDGAGITLSSSSPAKFVMCSRAQFFQVGSIAPATVEVEVISPGSGCTNLEVVLQYFDVDPPFNSSPIFY